MRLIILLSVLVFLNGCGSLQKHVKGTSYGGVFEKSKAAETLAANHAETDGLFTAETRIEPVVNTPKDKPGISAIAPLAKSALRHYIPKRPKAIFSKRAAKIEGPPVEEQPIEPNSSLGFWLVIGSLVLRILASVLLFALQPTFLGLGYSALSAIGLVVGLFSVIAMLVGFVLGIVGLGVHHQHPGKYRGLGKAWAAVIIPGIGILLTLVSLALLLMFW